MSSKQNCLVSEYNANIYFVGCESLTGVFVQFAPTFQTKLAAEAQAKYERELMLHAADVEALQQLKKAVGHEAAQKRELEEKVNKTCSLLQEKTTAWNALEKHLKVGLLAQRYKGNKTNRLYLHNYVVWNRTGYC